ncbi:unnamed protein product [Adineta ricciae]|uniref:Uncharacterized protein n=1 Tax=Adineta ricciae TaxID=249248 RepID=A0A814PLU0_ADIRI|nr:unnamed protein product [Adineta ricciae]CAF1125561.1 unnamed protein product [Adineta ricciae]
MFFASLRTFVNSVLTVWSYVQGVATHVSNFIFPTTTTVAPETTTTTINPYCQLPLCGSGHYSCPEEQLTQECLRQRLAFERLTTLQPIAKKSNADNDDDDDDKKKPDKNTNSSSGLVLVLIGAIVLGIGSYLYMRFSRQKPPTEIVDDTRNSSVWEV